MPFKTILIANRGEIACRIIRTCRKLNIRAVAVYSDADRDSLHVQMADEAVHIGGAASADSYLRIDRIVEACKQTGAEAVHPGFGFLSENAKFREALDAAGIAFIGPNAHAIAAMGDKIESKRLAQAAGVTTVPGYLGAIESDEQALQIAREIGLPVMLKASAGGGGKGMRIARTEAEVVEGLRGAMNEARSAFGDDRVFIEKYIENPRHIEIQVLADKHGTVLYLGERECSIQRRHQKVVEEAPSPLLTPETRAAMGQQAVALARGVNYDSAGTVEFVADQQANFYFLEMNTRLQVEHPVTELITGVDIVEQMIRVAAGQKLPFTQDTISLSGHAVEVRLYAEDPARGFLPATGRFSRFRPRLDELGLRLDTGVAEGGEIGMYYDPMVAKLIAHGADRATAIARLARALDRFEMAGMATNAAFLSAVLAHPRFRRAELSTDFIASEFPEGYAPRMPEGKLRNQLIAVAVQVQCARLARDSRLHPEEAGSGDWSIVIGRDIQPVKMRAVQGGMEVTVGDQSLSVASGWKLGKTLWEGRIDQDERAVQLSWQGEQLRLRHAGLEFTCRLLPPHVAGLMALMPEKAAPDLSAFLLSPMPGLLVSVAVKEGDSVKAGQELAVVEAMKMENVLRAVTDGVVGKVHAAPGESLAVDQKILEFGRQAA